MLVQEPSHHRTVVEPIEDCAMTVCLDHVVTVPAPYSNLIVTVL